MDYNTSFFYRNRLVIAGCAVVVLLGIAILVVMLVVPRMQQQQSAVPQESESIPSPPPTTPTSMVDDDLSDETSPGRPLPTIILENITIADSAVDPAIPAEESLTAPVLRLRGRDEELGIRIADIFGAGETVDNGDTIEAGTEDDSDAYFLYEKVNNSFFYLASDGVSLSEFDDGSGDIRQALISFLEEMELLDPSMILTSTYQVATFEDVFYYEFRRDWDTLRAPVLMNVGLVQLTDATPIAQMSFADVVTEEDESIINTSDNRDGFARANEFNTITIGVDRTRETVVYMYSTMRAPAPELNELESSDMIPEEEIISRAQAEELLRDGNYSFLIPLPTGEGVPDPDVIFSDEVLASTATEITDAGLALIEQAPGTAQQELLPHWVFRGTADLENGFTVRFAATVAALASGYGDDVLGVDTTSLLAQQQQTNLPTNPPEPTDTPAPTQSPTNIPTQPPQSDGEDPEEQDNQESPGFQRPPSERWEGSETPPPQIEVRQEVQQTVQEAATSCPTGWTPQGEPQIIDGMKFVLGPSPDQADPTVGTSYDWYYVPDDTAEDTPAFANRVFKSASANLNTALASNRFRFDNIAVGDIMRALRQAKQDGASNVCPARLTGISPVLLYTGAGSIGIDPMFDVSFSSQVRNDNRYWIIHKDTPIYYEYPQYLIPDGDAFYTTQTSISFIQQALNEIGDLFHFSQQEQDILWHEADRAIIKALAANGSIHHNLLDLISAKPDMIARISIIEREEIDSNLPLSVPDDVPFHRVHMKIELMDQASNVLDKNNTFIDNSGIITDTQHQSGYLIEIGAFAIIE